MEIFTYVRNDGNISIQLDHDIPKVLTANEALQVIASLQEIIEPAIYALANKLHAENPTQLVLFQERKGKPYYDLNNERRKWPTGVDKGAELDRRARLRREQEIRNAKDDECRAEEREEVDFVRWSN